MWHLLLLLFCPHVSPSVHIGAGNRLGPDVDVRSHPQKLDMSGDSEWSTKACSRNEAVCLFILGAFVLSGCLLSVSYFIHLKCSCVSTSLSDLHLWPPSFCHYFSLLVCRLVSFFFYQSVSLHISSASFSYYILPVSFSSYLHIFVWFFVLFN